MGLKQNGRTFTREEIDRVKRENPIEEVIARYVTLLRRGRSLVGLCPFHQETDPSFIVTPSMGRWHCFGACGEGGDVIDFIVRITGDSFTGAMERLGSNRLPPPVPIPANCGAPGLGSDRQGQSKSIELTRDDQRLLNAVAALYHTAFFLNPQPVKYVIDRGISITTTQRYMVGYARGDRLAPYLRYKGFKVGQAMALGLLRSVPLQAGLRSVPPHAGLRSVRPKSGLSRAGMYLDRGLEEFFRDRVVMAEIDSRGDVIHLIGRALDPEVKPKYLSAPGIPKPVYGMARLDPNRPVELVEGPFDYLTLLEWGYQGMATMGTHLSDGDARRLSEAPKVIITPDADDAGWSAASNWALAIGPDKVRFRILPEGVKDVNDLAQLPGGRAAFLNLPLLTLDEATGIREFDPGNPVIVVRSRFEMLALRELGYPAVCVLGCSITPEMAAVLAKATTSLILPENTEVGWRVCRDWPGVVGAGAQLVSLPEGVKTVREMANGGQAIFRDLVAGWKGNMP